MVGNWIRLIKNNLVNSLGIFIIVLLTIFLGTVFLETNQNLNKNIKEIEKGNVQDFSFYPEISEEDIEAAEYDYSMALENKAEYLANKFQFDYEKQNYKIIKENNKIYRIYPAERSIDKLYIVDGTLPEQGQICINYNYAAKNHFKVSDIITIDGTDYMISGICVFPDQLYPIVDNTGILYNKETQAIIAFQQTDYNNLAINDYNSFAGKFKSIMPDFKLLENDSSFNYIISSSDNTQIYASLNSQKTMNVIIMSFSMGILGMIAILILIITITRQIKAEMSQLGVLKALGYNNRELSAKYLAYFIIVAIPAIMGYLLGHYGTPGFYEIICSRFEIPYSENQINYFNLVVLAVCPAIFAAIVGYLTSIHSLKKPALHMIKEMNLNKRGRLIKRKNNKVKADKYLKGVKNTLLYSNMLLFIFVIFGGFALGVQIQFAYTTYNMTSNISDKVLEGMNYKSDVRYLDTIEEDLVPNNLYYYCKSGKLKLSSDSFSKIYDMYVIGDGDTNLLVMYDMKGNVIDLSQTDGIVINQLMALQSNLKIGDKVEFISGNDSIETTVSNISQSLYGTSIYMNKESALAVRFMESTVYNGMFTKETITFDSGIHQSISNIDNIKQTINQSNRIYIVLSVMLFLCGLVVGATVLGLSIFGVINNYRKYIAIMRINGYTEKECSYTVIDGFRNISMVGFLISIPYTYILCNIMFHIISKNSDMLYPVNFSVKSIGICFILTFILTETIIFVTKKQVTKISFKEIMEY